MLYDQCHEHLYITVGEVWDAQLDVGVIFSLIFATIQGAMFWFMWKRFSGS